MTTKQTWFGIEYEYKTKWGVTKWWIKKRKWGIMAIDFDALDLVRTENKDRLYQKKKKALEQLKELLKNYSSDTLIDMIMKESENKKNGTIKTKT